MDALNLTDEQRLSRLRRMKFVATGMLVGLAVLFVVAFILQKEYSGWSYVRAAAEGGMVGALADWFAVTALFKHPLGIPIPHTAIIPRKKDQLGQSLGTFFQQNFLESDVMAEKLAGLKLAARVGAWLEEPNNAQRVGHEVSSWAIGAIRATDDTAVRNLISDLVAEHMVEPEWSPTLGEVLTEVVEADHHTAALNLAVERVEGWALGNQTFFIDAVASRSPAWVPSKVDELLGQRIHRELLGYLRDVQSQPHHELRLQVRAWLEKLADEMQHDDSTRAKVEEIKKQIFADPQIGALAAQAWASAKNALLVQLADPISDLHCALVDAIKDFGTRLRTDPDLAARLDAWAVEAAQKMAQRFGPELVDVIGETIHRWDGKQAADTIELYAGRDLQFIRINGSIVGALAGLAIYSLATLIL